MPETTLTPATTGAHHIMREVNRGILLDILRSGGRMSRVDLARRAGLSKPTVSNIVEGLLEENLVREVGTGPSRRQGGRPPSLLEYNGAALSLVGVHLGVHLTHVALADATGAILARVAEPTIPGSPRRSARQVARMVRSLVAGSGDDAGALRCAGVSVPGPVDLATGRCLIAPNLGWRDVPVRELMAAALDIPVVAANLTSVAALAEGKLGAARGVRSYAWVYTGTGVGAGLVVNGELFHGGIGVTGEFGHCPTEDGTELCSCGNRGCLETVAGAAAISRAAREAVQRGADTLLRDASEEIDAAVVARAAAQGDPVAQDLLRTAGARLGRGIAYLLNIVGPEMVVIGGPLVQAGDLYLHAIAEATAHTLVQAPVPVVASTLGPRAGLLGAVQLAVDSSARSYRIVGAAS